MFSKIIRPQLLQILRPATSKILTSRMTVKCVEPRFADVQQKWRERDDIPSQYQLIYKAPMDNLINFATAYLTLTTTAVGAFSVYFAMFQFDKYHAHDPVVLGQDIVIANSGIECLTYLGAFIFFNVISKILLSQYVLRLYQDGDNYIAVYRGHMYNVIEKHYFNLHDFKKFEPFYAVPWSDSRYYAGGKKSIFLEHYFRSPEYLYYLMFKTKERVYGDKS